MNFHLTRWRLRMWDMRLRSRSPWYRDRLCALPNHHALYRALLRSFARGHAVALVLLDVDRMKKINLEIGHSRGDRVLQAVAAGLKAALPPRASIYRIGGNHFATILPGMREDEAKAWAEAGRRVVAASIVTAITPEETARVEPLTLKAGVAASPAGRRAFSHRAREQLLLRSERAWKMAAETGRDCVCTFSETGASQTTAADRPLY